MKQALQRDDLRCADYTYLIELYLFLAPQDLNRELCPISLNMYQETYSQTFNLSVKAFRSL